MDKCGCCQVCGRPEHELCDLNPGEGKYGICGDNLACRRKVEVSNECTTYIILETLYLSIYLCKKMYLGTYVIVLYYYSTRSL